MTDAAPPSPIHRTLACAVCGGDFSCTLHGDCWCGAEAVRLPLPLADAGLNDCICRACLHAFARLSPAPWRIDAVLLDMDGTLIDTERVYQSSLTRALGDNGYAGGADIARAMVGLPAAVCQDLLFTAYGDHVRLADVSAAFTGYRDAMMRDGLPLKAGAIALLDALRDADMPMAIVTSSHRDAAERHLATTGIRDRFTHVITQDDAPRGKPSPDLYLHAAEILRVTPQACVAVEDSIPGIAAAHGAGTIPIMVPDIAVPDADTRARCAVVVPHLHAVLQVLRFQSVL